jgi:hypothetical protein
MATSTTGPQLAFLGGGSPFAYVECGSGDGSVQAQIVDTNASILFRMDGNMSNPTGLILLINAGLGKASLFKVVSGSYTLLNNCSTDPTGHVVKVTFAGLNITVRDVTTSTDIGVFTLASGDAYATNTKHGVYGNGAGAHWKNWAYAS